MNTEHLTIIGAISLFIVVHIPLWRRFHSPYRHGGILHLAIKYSQSGTLLSNFDFYPSWRKHPLQVSEYQGFIKTLGIFLRFSGLQPMTMALVLQCIFTIIMALCLQSIMPPSLQWLAFAAAACCLAPLYLSITIMPDMYLMTTTSLVLALIHHQNMLPSPVLAILLGLSAWLGIRIKSSGFILAFCLCCVLPFLRLETGFSLLTVALALCPLIIDILLGRENMILQLLHRQQKYFGFSVTDEQRDTPPEVLSERNIFERLHGIIRLAVNGIAIALTPWARFGLYRSNGLIYLTGFAGIITYYSQSQSHSTQPMYIFMMVYLCTFLFFHTQLRRYFHFASRAGATLFPIWLVFSAILFTHLQQIGTLLIFLFLGIEGSKSAIAFFSTPPKSIYFEPPLTAPLHGEKAIDLLRNLLQHGDLLMLTYQDLNSFGIALQHWQIAIELEKTTTQTMCQYIDYYRYDQRYRKIYLILPPDRHLFLDKNLTPHFIEEDSLAARFTEIHQGEDLHGYRIFEACRPSRYADLTRYETMTPDQLKNNPIIFNS